MYSFIILLIIILIMIIYGIMEFAKHQKRIYSIPIRIHINGTRGKSSVTRLIGAGLRTGGIASIIKVTGTYPRLILEDGSETEIYRREKANILEQLAIVKFAASHKIQALVIECMALQPLYQWITENQMLHATIGVITNARLDHLDVMGPGLLDVAEALGKTIPSNQHFFTTEYRIPDVLRKIAEKRNTIMHLPMPDSVKKEEMKGFSYIEHRENVALALAVCEHLGIERNIALEGMYKAIPDAGALSRYNVEFFKKRMIFYNAFAANDPESSYMIWEMLKKEIGFEGLRIVLLNTRHDRLDRAKQLAEMIAQKLETELDYLILIGQSTDVVEDMSIANGMKRDKIINLGWTTPANVFEEILSITDNISTIVGIGNMGGMGAITAEYFENRSG